MDRRPFALLVLAAEKRVLPCVVKYPAAKCCLLCKMDSGAFLPKGESPVKK